MKARLARESATVRAFTLPKALSEARLDLSSINLTSFVILLAVFILLVSQSQAATGPAKAGIVETLVRWTPYLASAFVWNLTISALAMAIGTACGFALGVILVSTHGKVRFPFWLVTQVLRNSPWLVILFYCMYLIPYQVRIFGFVATTPDWIKATLGFALPVTAYVAEITRGGILSLPSAQWDSGESLALTRGQIMRMVIIPQCAKRMLPPWMNLYAFVTISTVLVNIVGITDILTAAREALNSDGRSELILPMYGYVLLWFFFYCYPIATLTTYLERRWAVRS